MLRIEVRFPLGVYHALSSARFGAPEWPPSPVRLVGALLAAAHEAPGSDTVAARAVLQRLSAAAPPTIAAPAVTTLDDPADDGRRRGTETVLALRGASRWAPRNHGASELDKGVSPRDLGRGRTEVHKGGVAIGDRPVTFLWPDVALSPAEDEVLRALLAELTFLGTSRSPVVARISGDDPDGERWEPTVPGEPGEAGVRVPDPRLLDAFDRRHDARRSTGRKPVANSEHVPAVPLGRTVPYALGSTRQTRLAAAPIDPRHWGDLIVLELDADTSDLRPTASAAFLLARAFREALLGAYAPAGRPGDAPPVLRGHGTDPHAAIVPLPFVGTVASARRGSAPVLADGLIRGIGVLLPHERRLPDVAEQRLRVEEGLRAFVLGDRRWIALPGAGRVRLRLPSPDRPLPRTLRDAHYRQASRTWETVLPVVHAHRRTSTGPRGVLRQVEADCRHVGLPSPERVELLTSPPHGGAPARLLPDRAVPEEWRGPLAGPRSHLRITFDRPVVGPVVLGRARHFGVGLCLPPDPVGPSRSEQSR